LTIPRAETRYAREENKGDDMKRETMDMGGRRATTRSRSARSTSQSRTTQTRSRNQSRGGTRSKTASSREAAPGRRRRATTSSARSRGGKIGSAKSTTDLNEIRRWAEERDGKPVSVKGTARGGAAGLLRIDFPGYSGAGKLEEISWDDWYQKFQESNLEFLYQDTTSDGQQSRFFKLVSRGTAQKKNSRSRSNSRARSGKRR
jgi:hypothetical protein